MVFGSEKVAKQKTTMESEEALKRELEELHKNLVKKHKFEEAVSSLRFLLRDRYLSASHPLRKQFYSVVCRVATVLKSRYTAPGFWLAGLGVFEEAEKLVSESSEKEYLRNFVGETKQYLNHSENPPVVSGSSSSNGGYLFEGHLTVDREPPQPLWLVRQNLENLLLAAQSSSDQGNNSIDQERFSHLLQDLVSQERVEELINDPEGILSLMMGNETRAPRAPPASKEVVAKLPLVTLTEEILAKLGNDVECPICKENLVLNDKMQELPCKHKFHPPCLKPWLDEHNSCPICRDELPTDDHNYESWKEREKEAAEERKGAANAVRGGEYMYV